MYQVIKVTKNTDGTESIEVMSSHKQEKHAVNKVARISGQGFSACWGQTYSVRKIEEVA